ncbi:MAG: stage III sporulation protein AE [Oscillospiraceae bacterium]|nr:stage III sporulation protein AE [Oscillospiraceae bacterium]
MKRIFCILLMFFVMGAVPVMGADGDVLENTVKASGVENIALPEGAGDFVDKKGINVSEPEKMLEITPKMVFDYILDGLKNKLLNPLKVLGKLFSVILLASLIAGMGDTVSSKGMSKVYGIISTLICVGIISEPVCSCIQSVSDTLICGGNFMVSYVPVFSGIVAASGNISSAGSYSVIIFAVCEVSTQIASKILMPLLGLCLAMAVVESINPAVSLSGITDGIKKAAVWGIGFIMTIFVGLLTIQSVIGVSADTVSAKAAKFVVSSVVPVVGGAISDAYSAIKGSLGILKSGVGSYGIAALLLTMLPSIISVVLLEAAVWCGAIVSEIFGVKEINSLLKNIVSVLSIALSLLLCFTMMLVVSTAIIMMLGLNMF